MEKKSNIKQFFEKPVTIILVLFIGLVFVIFCSVLAKQLGTDDANVTDTVVGDETNMKNQSEHSIGHDLRNYDESFGSSAKDYVYDYVDPETRVHYLIIRDTYYNSGRGGITVRYNSDGTIMVDDIDDTNGDASE